MQFFCFVFFSTPNKLHPNTFLFLLHPNTFLFLIKYILIHVCTNTYVYQQKNKKIKKVTLTTTIVCKYNTCYHVCIVLDTHDGKAHPQPDTICFMHPISPFSWFINKPRDVFTLSSGENSYISFPSSSSCELCKQLHRFRYIRWQLEGIFVSWDVFSTNHR